jgi:hypothetical protein
MAQPKAFTPEEFDLYTYASNSTGTRFTFSERQVFRDLLFDSYGITNYFNFWGEDRFYGRASVAGNPIRVSEGFLKQLRYAEGESLFAVNFVADAWRDFSERIRRLIQEGILYPDGPYAEPVATKAWSSPLAAYHEYMLDTIYPAFTRDFLSFSRGNKVKNVQDFLNYFGQFCEKTAAFAGPVTFSGFMESIYCSPLNTGLVIEISSDSHADDFEKEKSFFYDYNFSLVAQIATEYGFAIDKNAPWRFCADLSSPAMVEYMVGVDDLSRLPSRGPANMYIGDCDEPVYVDPSIPEPYGYSKIPGLEHVLRHAGRYEAFEPLAQSLYYTQDKIANVVFKAAFQETWASDMEILKYYLIGFYNVFVEGSPYIFEYNADRRPCAIHRNTVHLRQGVDPKQFSLEVGEFGPQWSLSCYYYLRLLEKDYKKTPPEKNKDIQSILTRYHFTEGTEHVKFLTALKYMQDRYIGPVVENRMFTSSNNEGILGSSPERSY